MPNRIIMPKTGMAMEEGILVRWLKQAGEPVSKGEAIAVIETDKVTMELESDYDGTLLAIVRRDGDVDRVDRRTGGEDPGGRGDRSGRGRRGRLPGTPAGREDLG